MFDIPQTGECLRYALRILQDLMKDPNCPKGLVLMYDISCKFHNYIKVRSIPDISEIQHRMSPETFSRLQFSIGIFHSFAHVYTCQVLYSPRRLLGVILSNGESCERFWSSIRHFIPSLRPAHGSTRRQILTYTHKHACSVCLRLSSLPSALH